ncbi:M20 family metallopeptidase [Lentibacillus sediminis]|uniref:M20 family metallopeptidase n=1 Tax=Lentibacillus sediminis TaxID=1940529 RepID=UPI001863B6B3|nr:M20 family metallopeptidase [Lentibacillus sediminis]
MTDVLDFLKDKQDDMVSLLKEIVEIESPSMDKECNDQMADKMALLFSNLTSGKSECIPNQTRGNHLRVTWGKGSDQILVLGHVDTVWRKGDLQRIPFKIEDGKAFGPGVYDMKGGLIQGIYALHALEELRKDVGCKVVFLLNSDEEIGSRTSRELIEEEARKSKCVLVLEPYISSRGALKTSRKGGGKFNIDVRGVSSHAGSEPEKGKNAIIELSRQMLYLNSLNNHQSGTTINVGIVKGGTKTNVVPDRADATVGFRVKSQEEADRIAALISGLKPYMQGVSIEVTGGLTRPPMEENEHTRRIFKMAQSIAKEKLHVDLQSQATGGGSDGNFTSSLSPTIDGLGAVGGGAHALHEHLIIDEMPKRSALVAYLIEELSHQEVVWQ